MLKSGEKNSRFARQKNNILTLVLSEKKILTETKNHNPPPPPPFKLNGRSLTQTAIQIGVEPRCSERVKISCSTNGTCRVTDVKIC